MHHRILLSLLLLPIFLKGFGNTDILTISVLSLFSYLFYLSDSKINKFLIIIFLVCFSISPSIIHLWAVLSFILVLERNLLGFSLTSVFLILLEYFYIPTSFLSLSFIYFTGFIINIILPKWTKVLYTILAFIALLFVVIDVLTIITGPQIYVEKYKNNSIYSPSELFCTTTNSKFSASNNEKKIMRSLMFNPSVDKKKHGIIVHEIETKDVYNIRHCDLWQQPTSWHNNQLLGSQYMLEAIAKDGGLYSNKGVCLNNIGNIKLAYPYSFNKSQPLIVELDGVTHLHDSDYTSSYLSNYQFCLNNEIMQNGLRPIYIRLFSIVVIISSLLLLYPNIVLSQYRIISLLFIVAYLLMFHMPKEGDIRIVGDITNSHENNKFDGVPKSIVNAGYNYTIGSTNAKVLVVSSGSFSMWLGESIVVLEPNARVFYKNAIISSKDIPLGYHNKIPDARHIIYNDKSYSGCIIIDSINIIATGSPSKLIWKDILK